MDASWHRCLSSYLQTIEDRSGSLASRRTFASTLKRFFATIADPATVSRADVQSFIDSRSTSNRNNGSTVFPSTKNQRRTILTSFYRYASTFEIQQPDGSYALLYQRPLPTLGIRYLKPNLTYRSMSYEELQSFFSAIPNDTIKGIRDRALYAFYFWSGRRRIELLRLRYQDIQSSVIVDTDGTRRNAYIYRYTGKGSSRQIRTKELPLPAWDLLQLYLERSGRLVTIQPTDFIWISVNPGQGYKDSRKGVPLNPDFVNREMKRYAQAAGLRSDLSLHSLRHAAASLRYQAGEDIRSIQTFLDHVYLSTTDIYLRALVGVSDKGAKLLQERFPDL